MAIGTLRTTGGRRLLATIGAGAATLCVLLTSSAAAPASACQPYRATGHDAAASPGAPFVGTQTVTIGGTTFSDVPAVTTAVAPLTPEGSSGVLTTTTTHAIGLPTGTITTIDRARLIPTGTAGVYRLVSHLVVTGGGSGQLELQGTVSFVTLTADGRFTGAVCLA
jgi:hypothetical protein